MKVADESMSQSRSSDLRCTERRVCRLSLALQNQRALLGTVKEADMDSGSVHFELVKEPSCGCGRLVCSPPQGQTICKLYRRQMIAVKHPYVWTPSDY